MKVMSEGIQKTAGSRLRDILAYMTQNRFAGVFTGFLTTCLVQSSSATTVMTISFVNAGLLTLVQSIGIIMGANIGTTITGWMVSILGFKFSIISIALPSVGIGLPLIFSKITKRKNLGEIFVGFGLLFLGLKFLKQSVPEVDSEILAFLSGYTQLGILSLLIFIAVGVILTIVVQSSSAAMTITITMAYSGWIDFPTACALVLGENIGTTITAYLASLNANYHAKRTARAHMIFNIAGVAWMIISFKYFIKFIDKILLDSHVPYSTDVYNSSPELFMNIPIHLSLFHTLFNIINVLLLIWFVPQIASIVERMVSPSEEEKEDDQYKLEYFSTGVQPVPEIAIIEVKKEVIKMSSKMIKMLNFFMETYKDRKNMTKSVSKAKKLEYLSDQMQEQISTYLAECTKHELSFESSKGAAAMMRIANELESVGDSTLNLFLQLERMEDGLKFDDRMNKEVLEIFNLVMKFIAWNHSLLKMTYNP
jgi:phosphate:Na+ symporter